MRTFPMIVLCVVLSTCTTPPSLLEQVIRTGELRVATVNTPATFFYGRDEPRGIEYELAEGFADRLGVGLRIYNVEQPWQVLPQIVEGKAHVGAGLTISDLRLAVADFGPSYHQVRQQVIYRRGKRRPREVADLIGGRLEVMAGSAAIPLLEEARNEAPALSWQVREDTGAEQLIRRVAEGATDYAVVTSHMFDLLRHLHPEARAAFDLGESPQGIAWALPKNGADTSLREAISSYFAELQATGTLQQILGRYYYDTARFDYVGSRAFKRHFNQRLPHYIAYFKEAEQQTGVDWRLLAAMSYQESHWDPQAVSPTGVRGMMMLTEHTARMMDVIDRKDPRESILGGARYFVKVKKKIPARIQEPDRLWLAVAAYNVGFGHLEDARILTQMQGANPDRWEEVRERLPLLSEEQWYRRVPRGYARGAEPVMYVDNIRRYYDMLLWLTADQMLTDEVFFRPKEESPG